MKILFLQEAYERQRRKGTWTCNESKVKRERNKKKAEMENLSLLRTERASAGRALLLVFENPGVFRDLGQGQTFCRVLLQELQGGKGWARQFSDMIDREGRRIIALTRTMRSLASLETVSGTCKSTLAIRL